MTINHELCSELLGPFLRGELDANRRSEVEAHLASCEACREELGALQALSGPEVEPLSELESARLHRNVLAAIGSLPRPARKPLGARLVPYLGTAAVLALFAVGAVTLSGDGVEERSGDGAQMESLDAVEDQDLDSARAEVSEAEAEEPEGVDNTRAVQSDVADETATLEAGAPGAEDETLSTGSDAAFGMTAKQLLFDLGCGIGVGAS